jgi:signal transduction histidine kinase/DNA-binding response OmpR family regulator
VHNDESAAAGLRVLLIDDNPDDRALVERELRLHIENLQVRHISDAGKLEDALADGSFDVAVTDYRLRWTTGTDVLKEIKRRHPGKPVIMFTGSGNEEVAVEAMKEGLDDYITKTSKHYPRVPYAVLGCVERATNRERLQKALERESLAKARLEIALQSAGMGTWQYDMHGNDLSYSDDIGPMFGRARGFTHASFDDWLNEVHPEDRPLVLAQWEAAVAGKSNYNAEFRALGADEEIRWIASSGKVLRDGGNLPKLVIGTARDISAAVSLKEEKRKQQEELQAIFDLLPVGVAISRDARAKHIVMTPYFSGLLGTEPGTNVSASGEMADALPFQCYQGGVPANPDDLPMQRAARTGEPVRGEELEIRRRDGSSVHALINTAPLLDEQGQVRGVVGALMDISALKKTQSELEESNRQKNEFLSVLAHELRNPMAAIGYSVELLRHVATPASIDKAREVIERQTAHMGKLLDDLLDLSRIARNKIALDMQPTDLRHIIELGYESARPLIEPMGHQVQLSLPAEPVTVVADEVRLTQVMSNLLNNAGKFTPSGGRIEVRLRRSGRMAQIEVIDNGIGIEPEKLNYVFEMFSQAQSKVTGGTSGLGIGLAIVKRLVELHGGSTKAFSDGSGQGTRVQFELPLAEASQTRVPTSAGSDVPGFHHGRVLVADDNTDAADLLAEVLQSVGYSVHTAYDGKSAIEMAQLRQPDVAILDIGMPLASGLEVARWIRKQDWAKDVLLVAVTGWGQSEDRNATMDAGFDMHLVKPVNATEIMRIVGERQSVRSGND